jgi:hypothetical protein
MIDKNLEKLMTFIEDIDALSPIDFFTTAQNLIPSNFNRKLDDSEDGVFEKHVSQHIEEAQKQGIDDDTLVYILFQNIYVLLRKKMIYSHAEQLGIEQNLFKNEMNKLFKGKFK